jgi:hypothetical protein
MIERMFEPEWDPAEWDPIPAAELTSIGAWDLPDVAGGPVAVPAGLDELIHEAQLRPVGLGTLPLLVSTPFELLSEEGRSLALRRLSEYAGYLDGLKAELTAVIAGPVRTSLCASREDFAAHEVAVRRKPACTPRTVRSPSLVTSPACCGRPARRCAPGS